MQTCFVDSATLWQVVQSLDLSASQQYVWSIEGLSLLTSLLLTNDHFYMAPGMDRSATTQIVAYDELLHRLLDLQVMRPFPMPSTKNKKLALAVAKRWAAKHIDKIDKFLDMLTDECSELCHWLEWDDRRLCNKWYGW